MCQKCDEKLNQFGEGEARVDALADALTESYNAGVDIIELLENKDRMGNSCIKVFIDQILDTKQKAIATIILEGGPMEDITESLFQLERESLIIAMFGTAELIKKGVPVEVWECDDLDDGGVLPCGHTAEQHQNMDEMRRKAGLS